MLTDCRFLFFVINNQDTCQIMLRWIYSNDDMAWLALLNLIDGPSHDTNNGDAIGSAHHTWEIRTVVEYSNCKPPGYLATDLGQ